jgi:hypothetical protein
MKGILIGGIIESGMTQAEDENCYLDLEVLNDGMTVELVERTVACNEAWGWCLNVAA